MGKGILHCFSAVFVYNNIKEIRQNIVQGGENMAERIEQLAINAIRVLSIDAIEKAKSGHPGMPMGAAPMAYVLWTEFMNHNPLNSKWFNRDRFVLSAGHASMLLYALLHLSGYKVSMEDIKNFRQWGSKTPGHPEYGLTDGVEATTGPLGQGLGMAVGMAMAERFLANKYNRGSYNIIDHYTYVIASDGDLMEGISHEAGSLAGHLKLGKLIVLYDSNDVTLDGDRHLSFTESVADRFKAYGWQVLRVDDGNDLDAIRNAISEAKKNTEQPTLIEVKTVLGYGAPNKAGKSDAHGAPLGEEEARLAKEYYKWEYEPFFIPEEIYEHYRAKVLERGKKAEEEWNKLFEAYKKEYPELAKELEDAINGNLPEDWDKDMPSYDKGAYATRDVSGEMINALAKNIPYFIGGSADLASSNKTAIKGEKPFGPTSNYTGRNIWFGVREFGMATALNGMALHGGLKVYGGTFLVFSDYLRPALRLSALMGVPVTYVFTHDSIAVGEDGPTHQPVEHLAAFRAMPNVSVIRPADGNETRAAWKLAVQSKNVPTVLILTRQKLPILPTTKERAEEGVAKGAYIVSDGEKETPDILLLASGSEVSLAVEVQKKLKEEGIDARVVSMPSWDRFEKQSEDYKNSVLPPQVKKRLAIEAAAPLGWERYVGNEGKVIGINTFGASAPGEKLMEEYGFTVNRIVEEAKALLRQIE
ncbi:transketolase [Caldanaerobacter subterraneus subsp. pacificus DSM 12653]|uniref:Transketolase n=2 Tax=Caldanaerobacter subterraneus TaxID=911092 RepID=A0A0F5PQ02_9THEO|nr:transketolase [Caldanaerobacter subterraneus subsp. pacificus DSM 12653]